MKKTYIFLTFAIYGIGGTQIYVRNKLRFLKERGWDVKVVTTELAGNNPLVVEDLSPYQDLVFPELLKNPNLYTGKERREILDRICAAIGEVSKESVIEPNFIQVTFWGELLAERLKIRNFVFLIQEDYRIRIKSYLDFFKFKFDRGELSVNTKYALKQLFDGYCKVPEGEDAYLSATCHNAVEEKDTPLINQLPTAEYIIGMIGRVNKPFVLPVIREIAEFTENYKEHTFLLMVLGGSPNKSDYDAINQVVDEVPNMSVLISGPIFPVPYKLITKGTVFVSSAGSVRTSSDCGMVTIAIDAVDFQPIGVYGYTTKELIHRPPELEVTPLNTLLEQVLFQNKYTSQPIFASDWPKIEQDFIEHLNRLDEAETNLEYYNIRRVKPALGLVINEIKSRRKR